MSKNTRNIIIGLVLIAIAVGGYAVTRMTSQSGESAASATVTEFGKNLQKVSLLAPDASTALVVFYGPYVTHELLASWKANMDLVPGKKTSSPWPDHIQITKVTPQGNGYVVTGGVVLMTSTGLAGVVPVVLQVVEQDGKWLIAAYQEQATSTSVE